jgi:hexulose-6-phosphate isomerase
MDGSINDKCKAIKEAGFAGIEPNSHMDRKEVIDALKANGLFCASVCCSTHGNRPLSHPDAAIQQEGIEGAIVALEDAHAYGSDAILLVPGRVNEDVAYDVCWSRSVEGIKKILPVAEKLKVSIGIENVWNNFLLSPMEACQYVDQFNSPYVKFYFDTGNYCHIGWPEHWIRILGNRINRIHIKEFSRRQASEGRTREGFNVKLLEGDINWNKVLSEARKVYNGTWMTTEQGSSTSLADLKDLNDRFDKLLSM